ncbi:hypothetical protein EVC12_028 [Rhizobium phage RHph_I42]|nr:hypothetical protein EVC12_028 [Rhizobium phage RHph_I42]
MSYDISIGTETFNITTNISRLFYDHFVVEERAASEHGLTADDIAIQHRGGLFTLQGLTGLDAIDAIEAFFKNVERGMFDNRRPNQVGHPDFCAKYDAKNGWGSTLHTLTWMARLLVACTRFPDERIRVSA